MGQVTSRPLPRQNADPGLFLFALRISSAFLFAGEETRGVHLHEGPSLRTRWASTILPSPFITLVFHFLHCLGVPLVNKNSARFPLRMHIRILLNMLFDVLYGSRNFVV